MTNISEEQLKTWIEEQPVYFVATAPHAGILGKTFSLLTVSSSRVRVLALKQAEQGDETIVRLVEMSGNPAPNVRISFPWGITAAREVDGQEQPVGPAVVRNGVLVTSFGPYQPRTFALRLGEPPQRAAAGATWRSPCWPWPGWRLPGTWPTSRPRRCPRLAARWVGATRCRLPSTHTSSGCL